MSLRTSFSVDSCSMQIPSRKPALGNWQVHLSFVLDLTPLLQVYQVLLQLMNFLGPAFFCEVELRLCRGLRKQDDGSGILAPGTEYYLTRQLFTQFP